MRDDGERAAADQGPWRARCGRCDRLVAESRVRARVDVDDALVADLRGHDWLASTLVVGPGPDLADRDVALQRDVGEVHVHHVIEAADELVAVREGMGTRWGCACLRHDSAGRTKKHSSQVWKSNHGTQPQWE